MSRAENRSNQRRKIRRRLEARGWTPEQVEAYVWDWECRVSKARENGTPLKPNQPHAKKRMVKQSPRERREVLMARDPHCHWCGCEVVYFELKPHQRAPANFATIDHVFSRLTGRPVKGETVLACQVCNERRSAEEQAALPKEELWRRSGAYPQALRLEVAK